MIVHGVELHEHIHQQIRIVMDVQHQDDVQLRQTDKHVHHMINVVQHQKHQHVMMEHGTQHHMDIHQQTRVVLHVNDVQVEQYKMDENVHHIALIQIVMIVMILR